MIYIIYTNEQRKDAEKILRFLREEKNLPMSSCNENWYELYEDDRIGQECTPAETRSIWLMNMEEMELWMDK